MRRLMVLITFVSALGVAFAAPVAAAPDKISLTWEVTCGSDTFIAQSPGNPPGWVGSAIGTTPSLFLGGHLYLYESGELVFDFYNPPPPGLSSQLETCTIVGPLEYAGEFQWVVDPAYLLFTPHA